MLTDEEAKKYVRELILVDKRYNELDEELNEYCDNHKCFCCPLMISRGKISGYYTCMFRDKLEVATES